MGVMRNIVILGCLFWCFPLAILLILMGADGTNGGVHSHHVDGSE